MTKKAYMKLTMNVVKIQQRASILSASDNYGVNKSLQTTGEPVNTAWSRGNGQYSDVWDEEEEQQ